MQGARSDIFQAYEHINLDSSNILTANLYFHSKRPGLNCINLKYMKVIVVLLSSSQPEGKV